MNRMLSKIAVLSLTLSLPALAGEVDRRENRQQARIVQGVKSGELTHKEAAKLEKREAKINAEVQRDRAMNGGKLTPAERTKINAEQNRASRAIYREKHDRQVR